jgi:hypothetical protein
MFKLLLLGVQVLLVGEASIFVTELLRLALSQVFALSSLWVAVIAARFFASQTLMPKRDQPRFHINISGVHG